MTGTVAAALDPTHTGYPIAAELDDSRKAKVVDVGCSPATERELPEVGACFMITTNKNCGNWGFFLTTENSVTGRTCNTGGSLSLDDTFWGTPSSLDRLHFEQLENPHNK